jgi:hypothetical protein
MTDFETNQSDAGYAVSPYLLGEIRDSSGRLQAAVQW